MLACGYLGVDKSDGMSGVDALGFRQFFLRFGE
jgi:hypothetical protein